MKVVMTGFAARCLENWMPLAHEIRLQGGVCDIAVFPRVSDPSNHALCNLKEHTLFNEPIDKDFAFLSAAGSVEKLCDKLVDYDLILMTSCIAGPELSIKSELRRRSSKAVIVGLQHGFYQLWETYAANWDSYDFFGVFGHAFIERFPKNLRNKILPLGLPKLDLIEPIPPQGNSQLLFCLQTTMPQQSVLSIAESLVGSGFEVTFKGHPEFPERYAALQAKGFSFVPSRTPLLQAMQNTDYLVTTGSTVVLEALQMQIPVSVIPAQAGSEYTPFNIVAQEPTGKSIAAVFQHYMSHEFQKNLLAQFEQHAGPKSGRSRFAYTALNRIASI